MTDDTTYEAPEDDDLVLVVDDESAIDDVIDPGRYGEQGNAELFDIQLKKPMKDGVPMTDRAGQELDYMDLAVCIEHEDGSKTYLHTGPFGRHTRIGKKTGSAWPRFSHQLGIAGKKKSEIIPMKVVVDVGVRTANTTVTGPDGDIVIERKFQTLLDIFPYEGGGA